MIGAALISNLLPAAAFLAVFVAGLFARSVLEHELEIWHRTHPRHRRPVETGGALRPGAFVGRPAEYPFRDDAETMVGGRR